MTEPAGRTQSDFDQFYKVSFSLYVKRVKHWLGPFHANAEDVTQEAFIVLMGKWGEAQKPDALLTVICRRMSWRIAAKAARSVPFESLEDRAVDEENPVAESTAFMAVESLLGNRLSADILRYQVDGYSNKEIAALLAGDQRWSTSGATCTAASINRLARHEKAIIRTLVPKVMSRGLDSETDYRVAVSRAITVLPTRQRAVFNLTLQGYFPSEIAARLNISANNASVNLHLACKALSGILGVTTLRNIPEVVRVYVHITPRTEGEDRWEIQAQRRRIAQLAEHMGLLPVSVRRILKPMGRIR